MCETHTEISVKFAQTALSDAPEYRIETINYRFAWSRTFLPEDIVHSDFTLFDLTVCVLRWSRLGCNGQELSTIDWHW